MIKGYGQGEEFAQAVPAEVVLPLQLLHVLRCRSARTRFEQAAAVHQRHDGQHFRGGAYFQNGEQVGQVIPEDIARHGDGVLAFDDAFQ